VGIKERREREKQYVRTMIMKIVNDIVSQEGWNAVTIRKIAEEIEYSPPIVYEHFENKDALLLQLKREAFEKLIKVIKKIMKESTDPKETLLVVASEYLNFCVNNTGYAKAILGLDGVPAGDNTELEEWQQCHQLLLEVLAEIAKESRLDNPEFLAFSEIVRSFWKGIISAVVIGDRRFQSKDRAMDLIKKGTEIVLNGYLQGVQHSEVQPEFQQVHREP